MPASFDPIAGRGPEGEPGPIGQPRRPAAGAQFLLDALFGDIGGPEFAARYGATPLPASSSAFTTPQLPLISALPGLGGLVDMLREASAGTPAPEDMTGLLGLAGPSTAVPAAPTAPRSPTPVTPSPIQPSEQEELAQAARAVLPRKDSLAPLADEMARGSAERNAAAAAADRGKPGAPVLIDQTRVPGVIAPGAQTAAGIQSAIAAAISADVEIQKRLATIEERKMDLANQKQELTKALAIAELTGQYEGKETLIATLKKRLVDIEEKLADLEAERIRGILAAANRGLALQEREGTRKHLRDTASLMGYSPPGIFAA